MDIGEIRSVDINDEMRAAYLDYAMSVIVSRALPDARDGLKPVHRRILYAMYDMGLRAGTPYRKSARIVGEVLGKYHPHGDGAVYDAMVRMAQDFAMRYPLVDGQGNFGSIDGDSAAAMRYTEARMQGLGVDMLADIDKQTVDFAENFDGSLYEPEVLPTNFPNLLVNGSSGIAVGMSTSVPPHNMGEVCSALVYMLDRWENLDDVTLPELMEFIKGPDFPTGGLVFRYDAKSDVDNLVHAYATGRGKIVVQARAHIEQLSRGRNRIIITELPFQINKTSLIERIASLVRDEKIEGLTDLRDESDRHGLRIVIDLTRNADPDEILKKLYKLTPMRSTFSIIMLALVDGEPRLLSLKMALKVYLEHRMEVVRRRSEFDLFRAKERAHILEGYLVALDNMDEVISIIRKSRTVETARTNLQKAFKLSEIQAQAILDMPLRRLAALERKKIEEEYQKKVRIIKFLERLLESPKMMRGVIQEELSALMESYHDPRRTVIVDGAVGTAVTVTDLLPDQENWVVLTRSGLLSRTFDDQQPRVTQSVKDAPRIVLAAGAGETLYFFTSDGLCATIPVHQVPQSNDFELGVNFSSLMPLRDEQEIVAGLAIDAGVEEGYLFLGTEAGMVKRIAIADLPGLVAREFTVIGLTDDRLRWAEWTSGQDEIVLVAAEGKAIRFAEEDVRPMGLPAGGVKGMKLGGKMDSVVGMTLYGENEHLWVVSARGDAKITPLTDYPQQGRYGQGVITYKFSDSSDRLCASASGRMNDNLVVVTTKGKPKYMRFSLAAANRRNAGGTNVIALGASESVGYVSVPRARSEFDEDIQSMSDSPGTEEDQYTQLGFSGE